MPPRAGNVTMRLPSEVSNGAAEELANELNGIKVPGTKTILSVVSLYSLLIMAIFFYGYFSKKRIVSWGAAVTLSLITIISLFLLRSTIMNTNRDQIFSKMTYQSMVKASISEELKQKGPVRNKQNVPAVVLGAERTQQSRRSVLEIDL